VIGLVAEGAVRVSEVEQESHCTPTSTALQGIASVMAGSLPGTLNFIVGIQYAVSSGDRTHVSDYVLLQATSPSQPGYLYGWQWVTLTGLTGFIGTAVGFAFSGMFTSSYSGTLTEFRLIGACYQDTDELGNPITVCPPLFTMALSLSVAQGTTVQFYSTIVTGLSGWSVIARSNYTGTISTVTANAHFLRNVSMLFLPRPVASLANTTPRGYIASLIVSTLRATTQVSAGLSQLTYHASLTPGSSLSIGTIRWVGRDTLYITYPLASTMTLLNTLSVVLSTAMSLRSATTHYFTLLITFTS
jgi:hypothetical protein